MKKLILLAAVISPVVASAQSSSAVAAYAAITHTPVGALTPLLTNTLLNRLQNGASAAARYGNLPSGDFNITTNGFGVTGLLPAGDGASLRITGGVLAGDNSALIGNQHTMELMLGVGGDVRLVGSSMGNEAASPLWTASLDGELGYGNRNPGTYFSGSVGLPIALVQRGAGMQFSPFITPGFAFGRASVSGSSESGAGLLLGGGLGLYNSESSVVVNVGAQHYFMSGAHTTIGINILFGGK